MKRMKIVIVKYLRVQEWLLEILEVRKERNQDLKLQEELHNSLRDKIWLLNFINLVYGVFS